MCYHPFATLHSKLIVVNRPENDIEKDHFGSKVVSFPDEQSLLIHVCLVHESEAGLGCSFRCIGGVGSS